MEKPGNGDWLENRKFVLEALAENKADHRQIIVALNSLEKFIRDSEKEAIDEVERRASIVDKDLKAIDARVKSLESIAENIKGRLVVTIAIVGVAATLLPHILDWLIKFLKYM